MAETRVLNVGLLGFGTVGSSFAEVLAASGCKDIRITHVFNRLLERKRAGEAAKFVQGARWTERVEEVLDSPDVHVVVELIGGVYPIEGWIRSALKSGKHVVTANKQLIATRGAGLFALAAEKNVQLLYGAAVAGGVPVIPGITQGLGGDEIWRVSGIVNGTCNFILSSMEQGADYDEVLANAQRAGYAEADPSADVDGYDARAKLCVLARLALGAELVPEDVPAQTISRVSAIDFAYAKEMDCTIRQVSRAERSPSLGVVALRGYSGAGGADAGAQESPIAWSRGTQNMVVTSGRFGGDVVFSGHGAGGHPTAVAVMSDVLAVAGESRQLQPVAEKVSLSGDVLAPHYLRFIVADEPGIVAAIAGALAKEHINIDSILQHRGHASERLPFVVTTEPCLRSTLDRAIEAIGAMSFLVEAPLVMQILVLDDTDRD